MDLASLLLFLAVFIPVGIYVARPLWAHTASALSPANRQLSTLLSERERLLAALQELDFDHSLGKIPADEYPARRAALVSEGADILRAIDETDSRPAARLPGGSPAPRPSAAAEADLEAAVARARGIPPALDPDLDAALERAVAAARTPQIPNPKSQIPNLQSEIRNPQSRFCPNCGSAAHPGDQFCSRCGRVLSTTPNPA